MIKNLKKIVAVLSAAALFTTLFFVLPPVESEAAEDVTIVGTVINTRNYYNVNGEVNAYGFLPATLTTAKIGGKNVELTACGAGTTPEILGTKDLSGYVGVTRAYTGKLTKSTLAPYKYTFVISSVADTPAPDYVSIMTSHLTSLGYINVQCIEYAPGEVACTASSPDFHCYFYYYLHGGVWGEINAVVTNVDNTATDLGYGTETPASGGFAKAQQVATIFSQYHSGAITKAAAQKSLNALQ